MGTKVYEPRTPANSNDYRTRPTGARRTCMMPAPDQAVHRDPTGHEHDELCPIDLELNEQELERFAAESSLQSAEREFVEALRKAVVYTTGRERGMPVDVGAATCTETPKPVRRKRSSGAA